MTTKSLTDRMRVQRNPRAKRIEFLTRQASAKGGDARKRLFKGLGGGGGGGAGGGGGFTGGGGGGQGN